MSRYAARKRFNNSGHGRHTSGQTDLYDVSVWVTTQSRGAYRDEVLRQPKKKSRSKEVGLLFGGSLIMQTVIGPGIFTSPKGVTEAAGSVGLNLVIWAICGIFTTMAALCFAEMQIFVKRDGCEYGYIHKAFGPLPSFVYTWMRIAVAEPITTAVFALAFAHYIADAIIDNCGPPKLLEQMLTVSIILSLAILNTYSLRLARQIQSLANLGKIVTIGIIIVTGAYRLGAGETGGLKEGFDNTETNHSKIIIGIYNCLWAYGGWAYVPNVTAAVRKPPKNLPRLVKIIIPSVMVIYLLTVTSYFTVLTEEEMVGAHSFGVLWGRKALGKAAFIIPIGVAMVALGNANNTFLSSGRLSQFSVHDGYIPDVLSFVHVKTKAPLPAIILRAVSGVVIALAVDVSQMVRFWVFTVWLFHGLAVGGLLIMRIRKPHLDRPYKVNIIIPFLVTLGSVYLILAPFIANEPRPEFIFSLCLAALSMLCYFPFVRWNCSEHMSGGKFTDKLTVFLQLFLNVSPFIKRYKRRLRTKRRHGPATVSPVVPDKPVVQEPSSPSSDMPFSDTMSIFTIDTIDDLDDTMTVDDRESVVSFNTNYSYRTNLSFRTRSSSSSSRPPPYEEAIEITKL
ncbi:b(0,+)-type amino acid transporter 1-like [Mizuhopecten yessoensis]|uniref:B(0,+)-type amino acid transporter 1 n=2 Tax=Mizuhopecten yessoensis TaxID=6573 RepID=A0A210QMD8_MIZYE|nr:b(0,+)-type amino acid transporter 1-like [Mizuhopecten yessoensis]OWF49895.1 B(0,+)-type amino acid transporter 1 [Mizuhopecten yessoensis]